MDAEWVRWLDPRYVYGAMAALLVTVLGLVWAWERRRSQALEGEAARLGFTFQRKDMRVHVVDLPRFDLFGYGRGHTSMNVMRGARGDGDAIVFGYRYRVGSGRSSNNYTQTVAAFRRMGRAVPRFRLCPGHVFHRIGVAFGGQDIDFIQHPEFSKAYRLQGTSEQAVRDAFAGRPLEILGRNTGWDIEGEGEWVIVYKANCRTRVTDLRAFVAEAEQLAGLF